MLLSGCGGTPGDGAGVDASPSLDVLPGEQVGRLAEQQLEAEHLEMATGKVTCPDLDWVLNASVRCLKISELSAGRRVKIPGTVTVTSTEGGGRLHVELDDQVTEFGLDGVELGRQVTAWVRAGSPSAGAATCPYLRGAIGASTRCTVDISGRQYVVLVEVTRVAAADYRTSYALSWAGAIPAPKASPTFVATEPPAVVD